MGDEFEQLEAAIKAVVEKYGYRQITIGYTENTDLQPWGCEVLYANGSKSGAGHGRTLRESLAAASAEALKSHAT